LQELRARYASLDLPMARKGYWHSDLVSSQLSLTHFRGDNPYVYQFRNVRHFTHAKYYFFLLYLAARDRLGLLERLKEDGMFGCWTFEYPGWPTISRDLLDSINELYFVHRETEILHRPGATVLDIGAGYGRMAHRMLTAAPQLGAYLCADAIPESTFLCEYYLRFRRLERAKVLPLHELDAQLMGRNIDLAINVHSFSEMSLAAIEGWVSRLAALRVPWLFVVPNEPTAPLSFEADGTRRPFLPLLRSLGYELKVQEAAVGDPTLREFVRMHDQFLMFRLSSDLLPD